MVTSGWLRRELHRFFPHTGKRIAITQKDETAAQVTVTRLVWPERLIRRCAWFDSHHARRAVAKVDLRVRNGEVSYYTCGDCAREAVNQSRGSCELVGWPADSASRLLLDKDGRL